MDLLPITANQENTMFQVVPFKNGTVAGIIETKNKQCRLLGVIFHHETLVSFQKGPGVRVHTNMETDDQALIQLAAAVIHLDLPMPIQFTHWPNVTFEWIPIHILEPALTAYE